jgi:hypothetical protein
MTKTEAAQLVLTVVVGVFTYFTVTGERLVAMKMFFTWSGLAVLAGSHLHSIYLLNMNEHMEPLVRYAALNLSALGLCVLGGTALFLKRYLREVLSANQQT